MKAAASRICAFQHTAWTPGKQPHGGCWPRWQQGCRSQEVSAACEVTPSYPPGHPWNNQGLERSPLTRPRKKKQWMLFWFNSTWAKMIAFIESLKDDTCTQCMGIYRHTFIWVILNSRSRISSPSFHHLTMRQLLQPQNPTVTPILSRYVHLFSGQQTFFSAPLMSRNSYQ